MPPTAAPVTVRPLLLVADVAETVDLFVSGVGSTLSVKLFVLTVPLLSFTLICRVYLPVDAGVHVWLVAVL